MKPKLLRVSLACLVLACSAAHADPASMNGASSNHNQQVTSGAWGGVCYNGPNNEYRCRQFGVSESTNWLDGSREIRVDYTFYRSSSTVNGYQFLTCVVDANSLKVTPNRATFDASVSEPTDGSCSTNWGTLCIDGSCQDWPVAMPFEVKGEMTNPGYEREHVTIQTNRDRESGVFTRQQCHGGEAGRVAGGGVSFSIAGGNFLYFPFGQMGTYGQANGQYLYDTCNAIGND